MMSIFSHDTIMLFMNFKKVEWTEIKIVMGAYNENGNLVLKS